MKYIFLSFLMIFTFSFSNISAQQNHFLYFQTENHQPFYVKLDNKIYSSTSLGYVIVPKLKEGRYTIAVGFPKNEWPEEKIPYKLDKDAGYLLKNYAEKGWGLVDLQSADVVMAGTGPQINNQPVPQPRDDEFSNMLATVVNDSTIKQNDDLVVNNDKKPVLEGKNKERIEPSQPGKEQKSIEDPVLNSVITKKLQMKGKGGMEMIYTDEYDSKKDTIRIFMPVEKADGKGNDSGASELPQIPVKADPGTGGQKNMEPVKSNDSLQSPNQVQVDKNANEPAGTGGIQDNNKENHPVKAADSGNLQNQPMLNKHESEAAVTDQGKEKDNAAEPVKKADRVKLQSQAQKNKNGKEVTTAEQKPDTTDLIYKSDKVKFIEYPPATTYKCKEQATEGDFFKLRKKMAAENNDEDMITAARKTFKSKCFTTENIRLLATLFLNDEGKYNFFDAAYPYVLDPVNFNTLENQMSDAYFIKRFKAMIHQ